MINLKIRKFESNFLYPVYDTNKRVIDVLPFEENYLKDYKNSENHIHGLSTLNTENMKSQKSHNYIYITDSLLSCITLYQETGGMPSIVLNNINIKIEVRIFKNLMSLNSKKLFFLAAKFT